MLTAIYNHIKTVLTGIKTEEDKAVIKTVDIWNNQTALPPEEQAFRLPAVFIEIPGAEYGQLLNGRQMAEPEIILHVITDSRKGKLETAMEINRRLCNLINSKLYATKSTVSGSIIRTRSENDGNFDEWIENRETYLCCAFDISAQKVWSNAEIEEIRIATIG